jgi:hypothetical protein
MGRWQYGSLWPDALRQTAKTWRKSPIPDHTAHLTRALGARLLTHQF